tara:strand:+ start:97 stop:573 length:477 start_codon:yes stop_codon:yes gene_type:complete
MNAFDLQIFLDDLLRLGVALLLGGLIGAERQLAGQSAGLRTHVMVAMGATVLTLVGLSVAGDQQVTRVVQGVASGIGFIGAGAILRARGDEKVKGLTTAASIWMSAAMGTAAGLGELPLAAAAGCAGLFVLAVLRPASRWLAKRAAKQTTSVGERDSL